jgi:DegV family protein with EDD domain
MGSICIVTDSSAQFTQLTNPGRTGVQVIPLKVEHAGQMYPNGDELKSSSLPVSVVTGSAPKLVPPTVDEFRELFLQLTQTHSHILGIFTSAQLCSCFANAQEAANIVRGGTDLQIIDSQSLSVGLGILVETALDAINQGQSAAAIEYLVRSMIPHIYGVLCTPGLSYLFRNGFLDRGQGLVGEMLSLLPIFALEEGHLVPLEKVKTIRHTETYFQEFLDEFDSLRHIALIQSAPAGNTEIHSLKEHAHEIFPKTPFTAHTINLPTAVLLGPRTMGMFVVEPVNHKKR